MQVNIRLTEQTYFYLSCPDNITVTKKDVTYAVRTPENPNNLNFTAPIKISKIKPCYPVIMITHGYTRNGKDDWLQDLANAYLAHANYSIILIDWERVATDVYITAAASCRAIGISTLTSISTISIYPFC